MHAKITSGGKWRTPLRPSAVVRPPPSGPRPVGCFSALLARPVSIQIWALRSRLEKQPTDPAPAGRCHHYMRDGTLASKTSLVFREPAPPLKDDFYCSERSHFFAAEGAREKA